MRPVLAAAALLLAATAVQGDVRLKVKSDGTKVIYNVGRAGRGTSDADLEWLAARHDRPSKYDPIIERWSSHYGVDPTLVRAVIQVESGFDPSAVSSKGARGLMQLMPGTAKRFGVTHVHDPEQNIRGGIRYLAKLVEMFDGDLPRALAGYNAGENAVLRHGGIPPYAETESYVRRAMTVYYGRPYGSIAVSFAGRTTGPRLRGGFTSTSAPAAVTSPKVVYLGTR
jgi:soluble lytic murein transglycosylase-like protein